MKRQAFATTSLTEAIVGFAQFVRSHGLNVGIQETQDALTAANKLLLTNKLLLKHSLKVLFCISPEERGLFDRLFSLYWDTNPIDLGETKNKTTLQGSVNKKANSHLVMLGQGNTTATVEEAKNVSGANGAERLQQTDFAKVDEVNARKLDELAQRLFHEIALRLRRRMKASRTDGHINLRRTIRRSLCYGGEPLDLYRRARKPKKQRLIVLLDVSGSMDKYSFFLLRFIVALRAHFRQLEAFVFSTSLIRISRAIQANRIETVLTMLSQQANNWSSGTKIGECLETFVDTYGKRTLNGSPTVIILSDGLETGSADHLAHQMRRIHRRAKKVIWLNPLKGMRGYEPIAKGMAAALPSVDEFRPAHTLQSLIDLETILAHA
ncbi:VWA domain-containing protein [Fibrella sp. HMF5335]|uniref:VWA domain-containing protein n=1 Tax=Fibrella rubiginis TaxID=2817060 RepID=A0A939GMD0_9BACT|nr:VWA domain-containing protein [Fibrella rubiginis]MBO0939048.1 VWA domain-containing protein [Fibrella rubiginis]